MTTIQFRRVLIVIILLSVAVGGAVVRRYADPASTTHDVATLLMLLWIPAVGNIIGWLIGRARLLRQRRKAASRPVPPDFASGAAFQPHAVMKVQLRPASVPAEDGPVRAGLHRCALVVENQGFSARWRLPADIAMRRGQMREVEVEFVTPALALAHVAAGTPFRMLVGESFIGDGQVVRLLPVVEPPTP